ncbi:MAG: MBL fold metallo-hydrolase [Candidatus Anstonellales archaeon]
MELIFIGVGGTRKVIARQPANIYSGGFRIHVDNLKFHIDPGPSAIIRSAQIGIKVEDTDVVVVSHAHIDHYNDIGIIAEAMNGYGFKKEGILICHKSCLSDNEKNTRAISKYAESLFKQVYALQSGDEINVEHIKSFDFKATKVDHDQLLGGMGFLLKIDGKKIGYTSDTGYFPGLFKQFDGCDALIANVVSIKKPKYNLHLFVDDLEMLYEEIKPKKLFIYHIGEDIINYGPKKLEKELRERFYERIHIPLSGEIFEI